MNDINITKDCKLIKVLAAQGRKERVDSASSEEASKIIAELATDPTPQHRHQIAQTVGYAVNEMQQGELNFLGLIADQKNINAGDKAAFNVRTGTIKAYVQAKGATTARSFVANKQVLVDTQEVSTRPAINLVDMRTGRVNMGDLLREANVAMTNEKLKKIEAVLHGAIDDFSSPFYGTGTGVVKATLDGQLNYFRRLGPVTILGDIAAVQQVSSLTGMAFATGETQRSNSMLDEYNNNGLLGRYNGASVVTMDNAYEDGQTTPILSPNWLYIVPGAATGDARNLKVVTEGTVNAFDSQDINDLVYEIRLDQWFGAAFVTGRLPMIGSYKIG